MTYQSNFTTGQDAADASKAQFIKSAVIGVAGIIGFIATAAIATNLGMVPAISAAVVLAGLFAAWTYYGATSGTGDVGSIEDERIKQAMQTCQQNVMIADADFNISYMNTTMVDMMRDAERDLQAELSNFNASRLLGSNMDIFHKNPSYQRSLLERLTHPHKTKLTVGPRSFSLIASPIFDDMNQRIGTVVEWEDNTAKTRQDATLNDRASMLEAINRSQAVIEFETDGTIITANQNFCSAMGYSVDEIKGKHHSMFAEPDYAASAAYNDFWTKLRGGEFIADEFKRLAKGGRETWIQASYNPIFDTNGKVSKVVKYATDITSAKILSADMGAQIDAIGKSQAVIEFELDGTIITANENFCATLGYSLNEIKGRHHSMFVDSAFAGTAEYKEFWEKLRRGEYVSDEFIRYGKGGKEVIIQASYNPILDVNGKLSKVVKYATDLTSGARMQSANRIKTALDNATTNVLVTDDAFNIVYVNDALNDMLKGNEAELRKEVPGFDLRKLMGSNMDVFHKDPSHQRRMLESLRETYKTDISVGELIFGLIATPIFNDAGERTSVVVEWEDKTEALRMEREERAVASDNARIKAALDATSTNVMVADAGYEIVYMNKSQEDMMRHAESDLKKSLRNFNANDLMGKNIDVFHVNPAHQRAMLDSLTATYSTEIEVSGRTFALIATPIFDNDGAREGTVVEWNDRTEEVARLKAEAIAAGENARVKSALDVATTSVMIADKDYNIAYMNTALEQMMREAETDLRKTLPQFNANNLQGVNMDIFHKNPAHQRGMLDRLTTTYETDLKVGDLHFHLIASPVFGADGERVGTVVEWGNETAEKNIEGEIQTVVDAVAQGDFSNSITVEGKEGFMLSMAENINAISSTVDAVTTDVGQMLQSLAQGDLTQRIDKAYGGVFGQLKDDANSTSDKLRDTVTAISSASTEVTSGAQEITQGASDLSVRTEQQAANLEETAASMEEMASTIKQNADNSDQASSLAASARDSANKGGEVVGEAVNAMGKIEDSSKKIADIIGVIDEIAFQTNLLALNAAVEAARAGDAGRGFAVVASEVRSLAQRSAQAAKDIKDLINESSDQVKGGVELVNATGESLGEIVESIRKVADIVAEISAASNEQATGADEINSAITQMDEMTQQNSALVEENASAAKAMTDQASDMNQRLGFFNTGGGGSAAPRAQLRTVSTSSSGGGGARAMQAQLAEQVVEDDDDWSEF
jgi:methyl-accepting chemotaxis protein